MRPQDEPIAPVPGVDLGLPEMLEYTGTGLISRSVNADDLLETTVFEDRADGGVDIRTEIAVDVEPVIDLVHAEHMATGGKSADGNLWHVAELPIPLLMGLAQRLGLESFYDLTKPEFAPYVTALVRDADYRRLSPTGGKA